MDSLILFPVCRWVHPWGRIQGMQGGKNRGHRVVWLRYRAQFRAALLYPGGGEEGRGGYCNVWVVARAWGNDKGWGRRGGGSILSPRPVTLKNPPLVRIHRCDDTLISRVTNWVRLMRSGAFNDVIWRNTVPPWTPSGMLGRI